MPAILAIPDLGMVLAGILLLALAYTLYLLRDLLVNSFSHIPLVGGFIGRSLAGLLDDARNAVISAAHHVFAGAEGLFAGISHYLLRMWDEGIHLAAETIVTVEHIATHQIPDAVKYLTAGILHNVARVEHDALNWYHDALRFAGSVESSLHADLVRLEQSVNGTINARITALTSYAQSLFNTAIADAIARVALLKADIYARLGLLQTWTAAELARLDVQARTLFRTAETDIATGVAAAEGAASMALGHAVSGIITDLDTWGNRAVSEVWPDSAGDIESLRRTLGGDFPDIRRLLDALGGLGAAGLAGTLIRSVAGTAAAVKALDDCVVPNCRNLSQLGKELHDLGSLGAAGALLAWLAFIAAEPVQAADDTVTVAAPLLDSVFGPLASLISAGAEHL